MLAWDGLAQCVDDLKASLESWSREEQAMDGHDGQQVLNPSAEIDQKLIWIETNQHQNFKT